MSVIKKRLALEEFRSLTPKHLSILLQNDYSIIKVAATPENELKLLLDTTILKTRAIIAEARASLPDFEIQTMDELNEEESRKYHLSTGYQSIDELFGGKGLETGAIYEFAGEFGSGKSQIALTMTVRAATTGTVLIVDTENTWKYSRLKQIALAIYGEQEAEKLLKNIRIVRPINAERQRLIIDALLADEGTRIQPTLKAQLPLSLVVVDSVTGLFRAEYPGRGVLSERQHLLSDHLKCLFTLARKNNIIVVVTNQVIHSPDIFNPGVRAVGGNVVGHACTYRLMISKKKGTLRIMTMVDSASLPVREVPFVLSEKGIEPPEKIS